MRHVSHGSQGIDRTAFADAWKDIFQTMINEEDIWEAWDKVDANKDDIITLYIALQHQNYCLCNTVSNLVKQWPTFHPPTTQEEPWKRGTLYETKD